MEWIVFGVAALVVAAFGLRSLINSVLKNRPESQLKSPEYTASVERLDALVREGTFMFLVHELIAPKLAAVVLCKDWENDLKYWDANVLAGNQEIPIARTFRFWDDSTYNGFPDAETVGDFDDMDRMMVRIMARIAGVPREHVDLMESHEPDRFEGFAWSLIDTQLKLHVPFTASTLVTMDDQREFYGTAMTLDDAVEYCVNRLKEKDILP